MSFRDIAHQFDGADTAFEAILQNLLALLGSARKLYVIAPIWTPPNLESTFAAPISVDALPDARAILPKSRLVRSMLP
jgi:hypothetical protein